jgi:undecaprenyl-diphosphatase
LSIWEAVFLGILQGVTEFLPVSSSGHLVIARTLLNVQEGGLAFDVLLNFATLIVVIFVYRESVKKILYEFVGMIKDFFKEKSLMVYKSKYRKYILLIVVGCIPAGLAGVLLDDLFEKLFSSITVVAFTLSITGLLLILGERIGKNNSIKVENMSFLNALLIGVFQAFAITPGISRSGSTIAGGLLNGLKKEDAAEFSFLMYIPLSLGATLIKFKDISLMFQNNSDSVVALIISFVTTLVVGFFAIQLLLNLLKKGKLHYFSYYCFGMSALLLINIFVLGTI